MGYFGSIAGSDDQTVDTVFYKLVNDIYLLLVIKGGLSYKNAAAISGQRRNRPSERA